MIAVFRKELRSFYTNMTGIIFAAFLLLVSGIFTVAVNLRSGYPNFEYMLSSTYFIYMIIVPILTMRSFSDERHRKTDQLLYSLPLKIRDVVAGKYLAMVTVLAAPTLLLALIPPILSIYGTVNFAAAYGTLFAFFLIGCALIAIGMFFSSLTESQIIAAVLSFSALLVCYLAKGISGLIPSTPIASFIALSVLAAVAAIAAYMLTKNTTVGGSVYIVLQLLLALLYFIKSSIFENLFPTVIASLGVFDRLDSFVGGIFDLSAVVYYLTVICLFCYLTAKTMQQRRWA